MEQDASNSFIEAVEKILQPATLFDDWSDQMNHARSFLMVMWESGLTLKLEKCKFAMPAVTFVGHCVGSGRHGPEASKVACVETKKTPVTKKEVRQILGFFSYFWL